MVKAISHAEADGEKAMDGRVLRGMSILTSSSMAILGIQNAHSIAKNYPLYTLS